MHVILVKVGEIHLKGQNRPFFERRLMDNIREALKGSEARISIAQSRIYIKNISDAYLDQALDRHLLEFLEYMPFRLRFRSKRIWNK